MNVFLGNNTKTKTNYWTEIGVPQIYTSDYFGRRWFIGTVFWAVINVVADNTSLTGDQCWSRFLLLRRLPRWPEHLAWFTPRCRWRHHHLLAGSIYRLALYHAALRATGAIRRPFLSAMDRPPHHWLKQTGRKATHEAGTSTIPPSIRRAWGPSAGHAELGWTYCWIWIFKKNAFNIILGNTLSLLFCNSSYLYLAVSEMLFWFLLPFLQKMYLK